MIKVLLVDDEKLALEYLENIISWEDYGFEIVGTTRDSAQALNICKAARPELVITDVKMPGMNGLELVEQIREYGLGAHILFLSAYRNFDYVKQAIRMGIDDYLLKSDIDETSLLKKLLQLKDEITQEQAKQKYTISAIAEDLFQKGASEEDYKNILDSNDYISIHRKYGFVLLAEKAMPAALEKYFRRVLRDNVEQSFSHACAGLEDPLQFQTVAVFAVTGNEYLSVLNLKGDAFSEKAVREALCQVALRLFSAMNTSEQHQYCVYFFPHMASIRQFGKIYAENRGQVVRRYLEDKVAVLEFLTQPPAAKSEHAAPSADELYRLIKDRNQTGISRYLEELRGTIEKGNAPEYFLYIENMLEALSLFDGTLAGKISGRRFSVSEYSADYDFRRAKEIVRFLEFKLQEIDRIFEESESGSYPAPITDAIGYICSHFGDPELSAAIVARKVNISSPYLSTRFKEEVGIGINDYISNVRMEQAKKLLHRNELMVYEVAEQVGFASSQYFSRIFKEYTGITPNQYRRKEC